MPETPPAVPASAPASEDAGENVDTGDASDAGDAGDAGETGDARLAVEAARLHLRYTVEVVERFNLCPFARHARDASEVERHVLLQATPDPAPTLALLDALERGTRAPVAIAIFPRLRLDPRAFDAFAAEIKAADQRRHGGKPVYVSATFHPDYPLDRRSPAALVPYLRRSPDPSLQLVRLAILEEARGKHGHGTFLFDYSAASWQELQRRMTSPSVEQRIARDNLETVEREGEAAFDAIFRDLREDRARAYRPLGIDW